MRFATQGGDMTHDGCPCRAATPEADNLVHMTADGPDESRLPRRRDALIMGPAALAAVLLGLLRAGDTPAALARALKKKFPPPAGSRSIGSINRLTAGSAL